MDNNSHSYEWIEIYKHIKDILCGRCEIKNCSVTQKLKCYENFLWIASEAVKNGNKAKFIADRGKGEQ